MKKEKLQVLLLMFFVVFALVSCGGASTTSTAESSSTPAPNWEYFTNVDQMTGDTTHWAECVSENAEKFDFPYDGGSYLSINVRNTGGKQDAWIKIDKGQFSIAPTFGEGISVRFDDGEVLKFACVAPSDGSGDLLFINKTKKFLPLLKGSKTMMIKVEFWREGTRTFKFKTEGLNI